MTPVNVQNNKIKYCILPAKLAEEIPRFFLDLIGPYLIRMKCEKENLHVRDVTMINTVTGWFKIAHHDNKRAISIADLVETTWLSRYPGPIEITHDQGKEFIGPKFKKSLIKT